MRVIAVKTLRDYWAKNPLCKQSLLAWYEEATAATWKNPNELKLQYHNALVINEKRVVFNIHGNSFRLIVDIEYRLQIVFIVWIGAHKDYDKINVEKVSYDKAD